MKKKSERKSSPRSAISAAVPKTGANHAERKEVGKAARQAVPLEAHAKLYIDQKDRDIVEVLEESNIGRISELIPLRYGRMLASPFTFYRGSAGLMAMDMEHTPTSGLIVQACGDCHIHNFGAFATPERKIVIDINDFDETLPAPWEWDVKRLAASLVLAAVSNGMPLDVGQEATALMVQAYREHMAELAEMTHLEVWYSHVEATRLLNLGKGEARQRRQKQLDDAVKNLRLRC